MTLPTRPDGGVDWEKITLGPEQEISADGVRLGVHRLGRLIAAHTRERCARWHEAQSFTAKTYNSGEMNFHKQSAAAIRGMED